MVRSKGNKAKAAKRAAAAAASPVASSSAPAFSADDLLLKAHTLVAQQDHALAALFLQRVLSADANHVEARELLGVCELENGNVDEARSHFLHLVSSPANASTDLSAPYLYLAQLSATPQESLAHFEAAIRSLETQLAELVESKAEGAAQSEDEKEVERELRAQICGALVGMTEVYLTDLCFEPLAPEKCDLLLNKALTVSPTDSDAWICLASVRMSQEREEDAKGCAMKGWETWRGKDLGNPLIPPIPTRLTLARLLLELSLYPSALRILRMVREEDDEDVEATYLEGWAWFLRGQAIEEDAAAAASGGGAKGKGRAQDGWDEEAEDGEGEVTKVGCWEEARESLTLCELLHRAQEHPAKEVLEHLSELFPQLDAAGIRPAQRIVDGDDADEGDDWEEDGGGDMDEDEDDEMEG